MKYLQHNIILNSLKHLSVLSFLVLFGSLKVYAEEPISIGIMKFYGELGYAEIIQSQVADCFSSKSRFITVDRSNLEQIERERDLQKSETFIDGFIAEQGKSIGAQYIVLGSLISYGANAETFKTKPDERGNYKVYTMYKGYLNFSVSIIDVTTGKAILNQNFNVQTTQSSNSFGASVLKGFASGLTGTVSHEGYFNTSAQAIDAVFRSPFIKGNVKAQINKIFPVNMKIIKVESLDKKGLPSTVLIKGGADTDLIKGSDIVVILNETMEVDGQEYKKSKEIGKLKVLEVQGEFSICKIVNGEIEIQAKLNEKAPMALNIISYK